MIKEVLLKGAAIVTTVLVGAVIAEKAGDVFDAGKDSYDYFTATETKKDHFWSKPKTYRKWNGKEV